MEVTTTPLMFSTPVAGVADAQSVDRTGGGRATARFVRVSSASLLPGNVLRPDGRAALESPAEPATRTCHPRPGEPE